MLNIHHSIITQAAEQLACDPIVAEAILQGTAWGTGWSTQGDIVIFINTNAFNEQTQRQYERKIPISWLKTRRLWHEGNNIVSVNSDNRYVTSQEQQWHRFCRLSVWDLDAAIQATEWGCYFLSGQDYQSCGHDTTQNFFLLS